MRNWLRKQTYGLRSWKAGGPLILIVATLIYSLMAQEFTGDILRSISEVLGYTVGSVAIGIVVIVTLGVAVFFVLGRTDREVPPLPVDTNLLVQRTFTPSELEAIRTGLHAEIYDGVAPKDEQVELMYKKNPCMGVAIYHKTLKDYVAFATAWPINEVAADKLIKGIIDENCLTADDVLESELNMKAKFIIIPAFGVSAGYSGPEPLCTILWYEFRRTIRENFFGDQDRHITAIATGFSGSGRRLCRELYKMEEKSQVHMKGKLEPVPVFCRVISRADVN